MTLEEAKLEGYKVWFRQPDILDSSNDFVVLGKMGEWYQIENGWKRDEKLFFGFEPRI